MLTNSIQQKIDELFENTPNDIGVGYGKKITNGEYTGEVAIIFHVKEKLPLVLIDKELRKEFTCEKPNISGIEFEPEKIEKKPSLNNDSRKENSESKSSNVSKVNNAPIQIAFSHNQNQNQDQNQSKTQYEYLTVEKTLTYNDLLSIDSKVNNFLRPFLLEIEKALLC